MRRFISFCFSIISVYYFHASVAYGDGKVESSYECGLRNKHYSVYGRNNTHWEEDIPFCQLLRVTITTPMINLFGPFRREDVSLEEQYKEDPEEQCPCDKYCERFGFDLCPDTATVGDDEVTPGGDDEKKPEELMRWLLEHLDQLNKGELQVLTDLMRSLGLLGTPTPTPTPTPASARSAVKAATPVPSTTPKPVSSLTK